MKTKSLQTCNTTNLKPNTYEQIIPWHIKKLLKTSKKKDHLKSSQERPIMYTRKNAIQKTAEQHLYNAGKTVNLEIHK